MADPLIEAEFLTLLLVDQGPTARILALWTFRPDFSPPWTGRSHLTQVTLHRLPRQQAMEMTERVAHGKALPAEVVAQVVAKTDGVPLFVEELTKMVLESGLLQEREDRYELTGPLPPLAIPTTLHDSLMARLDRLATVKSLAQLGATLGREFSYELAARDRGTRGPCSAGCTSWWRRSSCTSGGCLHRRRFKHALIQDAAYQSLLRSSPPAVPSAHCPGVGGALSRSLRDPARVAGAALYRGRLDGASRSPLAAGGQRAVQRSAHVEAVAHLTRGLALLTMLPDTPERARQELALQLALADSLAATRGFAAPAVGEACARARELCQQVGETAQLFRLLARLWSFHLVRAELQTAHELAQQRLTLAQQMGDPTALLSAHQALDKSCSILVR